MCGFEGDEDDDPSEDELLDIPPEVPYVSREGEHGRESAEGEDELQT